MVVDLRIDRRIMPSSTRRDPTAQRRKFPSLKKKTQRQASWLELSLKVRTENARLNARPLRLPIDLKHAIKMIEVDRHRSPIVFIARGGSRRQRRSILQPKGIAARSFSPHQSSSALIS